jgi:hypothetical protein
MAWRSKYHLGLQQNRKTAAAAVFLIDDIDIFHICFFKTFFVKWQLSTFPTTITLSARWLRFTVIEQGYPQNIKVLLWLTFAWQRPWSTSYPSCKNWNCMLNVLFSMFFLFVARRLSKKLKSLFSCDEIKLN